MTNIVCCTNLNETAAHQSVGVELLALMFHLIECSDKDLRMFHAPLARSMGLHMKR